MNRRRAVGIAALAVVATACTRDVTSQEATTTLPLITTTTTAALTTAPLTAPPTGAATTAAPTAPATPPPTPAPTAPTTIPIVTSDIVGVAQAGNSGGVGPDQTDSFSEAVRNEDGTCSGWAGRGVPTPWTDGLVSGAPFVILPPDGHDVLAQGTLGASTFENVGTNTEQWMCSFPFTFTITGAPDEFMIKVANLDPWLMRRDPTQPDRFVGSVNTVASEQYFPECTGQTASPVTAWRSVGTYWSNGISTLCNSGLTIDHIERPCRGPHEGSDYVVKVVDAVDPNVVYEDASGLLVDVATLAPGTPVVVLVATGRPCG